MTRKRLMVHIPVRRKDSSFKVFGPKDSTMSEKDMDAICKDSIVRPILDLHMNPMSAGQPWYMVYLDFQTCQTMDPVLPILSLSFGILFCALFEVPVWPISYASCEP